MENINELINNASFFTEDNIIPDNLYIHIYFINNFRRDVVEESMNWKVSQGNEI